jgi:hypothetical protein
VEIRKVEEEEPRSFVQGGNEFHPEVEQFGTGGIPFQGGGSKKSQKNDKPVEGSVKRKKTRRSRR